MKTIKSFNELTASQKAKAMTVDFHAGKKIDPKKTTWFFLNGTFSCIPAVPVFVDTIFEADDENGYAETDMLALLMGA